MAPKKICIVGSGNWGSAIAKLVGENAAQNPEMFQNEVNMWVFEEMVEGQKLTEIINTKHENVKYLPGKIEHRLRTISELLMHHYISQFHIFPAGRTLPKNVIAVPDIVDAASQADVLIFVIPHQFLERSLAPLKGKLKPSAEGISLIKGFMIVPGKSVFKMCLRYFWFD